VQDPMDSDLEPPDQRCNKLILLCKKTNAVYIHMAQGKLILSLLLCVFLLL